MKPFKNLLAAADSATYEQSNVFYMDMLDENADSEDTMFQVAQSLLEDLTPDQNQHVVLVGDGKTYDHLLKLKKQH